MNTLIFMQIVPLLITPVVPENIEYCSNIIHNPTMTEKFEKYCDLEKTLEYNLNVKLWK